jgi:hypothetical protein
MGDDHELADPELQAGGCFGRADPASCPHAHDSDRSTGRVDMKRDIPCPVQRALAKAGHIGENVPLLPFADLAVAAFAAHGALAAQLKVALSAIGAMANGAGSIPRNVASGFRPHELRDGPLDKHGGGTRILSQAGEFDPAEMERFESFGRAYPKADGSGTELGWGLGELKSYLDANQARGGGSFIERHVLMEGELPQLLQLMGQGEGKDHHLSATEVRTLYRDQKLPERIEQRIAGLQVKDPTQP